MTRLLVNVTFAPDRTLADDFVSWARSAYLRRIAETRGCSGGKLLRIAAATDSEEDALTYAIQFLADDPGTAIGWLETTLPALLAGFFEGRQPEQMPLYPTIMEVIDEC